MDDNAGLMVGINVTMIISMGTSVVPAVLAEEIVSTGGQNYIFRVKKQDAAVIVFERVRLAKGLAGIGYTKINPVKEGSKIVVKKNFFVRIEMVNTGEKG
ncbi:hypothetical protein A0256_13265 [Mucilaginibacter sp. PAMC 26640]|nr:hypothetical protein A0256_13265 [Mucilaginibacter sp. PAMC 26640]